MMFIVGSCKSLMLGLRFVAGMRFVVFFLLLVVADSCDNFWNKWERYSCIAPISQVSCYRSEKFSFAYLTKKLMTTSCKNDSLHPDLMRCLEAKDVQHLTISNCYMTDFDVRRFVSNARVVDITISYTSTAKNFDGVYFNNLPFLTQISLIGMRTSGILNVTFDRLPSLTTLKIIDHDFNTFLHRPFENLNNLAELEVKNGTLRILTSEVFFGLQALKILNLSSNHISEIPPLVFRDLVQLQKLDLSKNRIANLSADTFAGLSSLKLLYLKRNRLTALPENLLSPCPRLMFFAISGNQISAFPPGFLRGLKEFEYLAAINCSLSHLQEDFFADAQKLAGIFLTNNQLRHLPSGLFANNKNLKIIYLSVNRLANLPSNIFDGLVQLEKLVLTFNGLQTLPENIFRYLSTLELLDLNYNRITLLPENVFLPLTNLRILKLSHNSISRIGGTYPFGASMRLEIVSMSSSSLEELPTINWAEHNLLSLDFSKNRLEKVTLPIYTSNRITIDLSENNISTINLDTLKYGCTSPQYNIKDNNIVCNCQLRQFLHALNFKSQLSLRIFPDVQYLNCHGEHDRNLLDVQPAYALCPIQEGCPENCNCFRDIDQTIVNCSGKGMKEVPHVLVERATVVDLRHNDISRLSKFQAKNWENVARLYLSNNSLSSLTDWEFPSSLTFLALDGNELSALPAALMSRIDYSSTLKISLSENCWMCGCDSLFSKEWLLYNREKITDFSSVSCQNTSSASSFLQVVSSQKCSVNTVFSAGWQIAVICVVVILAALIVAIFIYFPYRKNMFKHLRLL